jgi:hypothetical protein
MTTPADPSPDVSSPDSPADSFDGPPEGPGTARARSERGAVLVEFSIVAILLLVLAAVVFELGSAWSDSQLVTQSARSGARGASQIGIGPQADSFAVQAVEAALGDLTPFVTRVVVYDAGAADGSMPPACVGAGPPGIAGSCSIYDQTSFGTYGSWTDGAWPPSARDNTFQTSDYVGVEVSISRPTLTNFLQFNFTITDATVMRIEPEAGS